MTGGHDKHLWTSHQATFTEQADGSWVARYPGFSWQATGATRAEVEAELDAQMQARLHTPEYFDELRALIDNALDPDGTPVPGFEAA